MVGSFSANLFGLYDVHGNVKELVEDCWHYDYRGAPHDGSVWTRESRRWGSLDCIHWVVRGGSWENWPERLRSAYRIRYSPESRVYIPSVGLRVARTLTPPPPGEAARAYEAAKEVGTVAAYQAVIDWFPGSDEARLAQAQIDEIKLPPPPLPPDKRVPGTRFQDCPECPRLVVVPSRSYTMGQLPSEKVQGRRFRPEVPEHPVTIAEELAVGIHEVTFSHWDACHRARGCSHDPGDNGWGRGNRPVIEVSWNDAKEYVGWLSRKTGQKYRLLSESEWEYVARAGTTTGPFHTGSAISTEQANYDGSRAGGLYRGRTIDVGSLASNAFGLHDVHGNVREWVEDCWHSDYHGAPEDGSAWTLGGSCNERVLRDGSWSKNQLYARVSYRVGLDARSRFSEIGFRVARTLN